MVNGVYTQAQVDLILGSNSCPLLYTSYRIWLICMWVHGNRSFYKLGHKKLNWSFSDSHGEKVKNGQKGTT